MTAGAFFSRPLPTNLNGPKTTEPYRSRRALGGASVSAGNLIHRLTVSWSQAGAQTHEHVPVPNDIKLRNSAYGGKPLDELTEYGDREGVLFS